jgi:hypothetical protein
MGSCHALMRARKEISRDQAGWRVHGTDVPRAFPGAGADSTRVRPAGVAQVREYLSELASS